MKFKNIENIDDFGGDKVFTLAVENVDDKFVQMAKEADGADYDENCFSVWVNYDADKNEYYVCQDSIDSELFYVNNNGEKIWMPYILTDEETKEMIDACKTIDEECDGDYIPSAANGDYSPSNPWDSPRLLN